MFKNQLQDKSSQVNSSVAENKSADQTAKRKERIERKKKKTQHFKDILKHISSMLI